MSPGANTRNLIILGMHRSGTSMVAGSIAAGLRAGDSEELLAPQVDNPRGFWERRDVVALNDRLLAQTGASWFQPGEEAVELDATADLELDAIFERLGDQGWLLKDPRLLLTWPAWEQRLRDCLVLFVYRGAEGVVNSLERRNGLPLDYGLALWQYYNEKALEILREREFLAVSYEQFAANPQAELRALLQKLAQLGVAVDESALADNFFDRQLDHTPAADSPVPGLLSPAQRELHDTCLELVSSSRVPTRFTGVDSRSLVRIASMARAYSQVVDAQQLSRQHDELVGDYQALTQAHQRDNDELALLRNIREELLLMTARADELQQALALNEQALRETSDKADYLFQQLDFSYHKLLSFAESGLGGVYRVLALFYKLLTRQRHQSTAYEDVLRDAAEHFSHHPRPAATGDASRLRLIANVVRYVLAHPVASLRSFSWPRLKRALLIFRGAERKDLALWVNQRFPEASNTSLAPMLPELGEELDSLELDFAICAQPRVSIIVPVYNQYRMTMFCLRSLLQHSTDIAYEVILADDASTDLTATIEGRVSGLVLERADDNRGFVRNCNAGAKRARGEYLLFLNNDTGLTASWLSTLVATLDRDATAGVAGPKLLYGNGRLQEAGGIIWDDASGWNYGRMDDPGEPAYNYLCEVDYVSGACLLVRRSLWEEVNGFDTRYAPAYYEDTDLCFSARAAGYRVLYQPAAAVFHFEGVSNGTDLESGIKQHQLVNQEKFASKWEAVLRDEHFPNGEAIFQARNRSRKRRTVLVIDHFVPSYDKDAGSRSTWMYLQLLVEMGYNVKFIGANFFPHQPYTQALQQLGVEVLVGESMARNLDSWLKRHAADIHAIYLHRPHVAEQFLGSLQKMQPRPTLVFFGHDLHYLRKQRELELIPDPVVRSEAADWRQREYRLFEHMDHIYYPSQVEVDEIQSHCAHPSVRAIPLYLVEDKPLPDYVPASRGGMLFVGGFNHPPNADGVRWFVDQVLPLVRARAPRLELHIVGSNMPEEIKVLAEHGVVVHGYLDDEALAALYTRIKMAVVPLRYGAGVKGKVIEALQQGVPLVSTSIGAEGLPDAETVIHIADEPADFAAKILAVESADPVVNELLRSYNRYLAEHFSKARARAIISRDFGEPVLASI